jgi:hypothetical protein
LFPFFYPYHAAQQKPLPINEEIEKVITEIKEFSKNESKVDSVAGHPLGSNKEDDFLRRNSFYSTVSAKLNSIDKKKLTFDDQINLELLHIA